MPETRNRRQTGRSEFEFVKEERRVGMYYFYILDSAFGPGFIKICTYFPYPAKVWFNGHEWAKRQADREGMIYTSLANRFVACPEPAPFRPSATASVQPTPRTSSTAGHR